MNNNDIVIGAICGAITSIVINAVVPVHLRQTVFIGIVFAGFVVMGIILLREYIFKKKYIKLFLLGYMEPKFDYEQEYHAFILKFWRWNLIKYIDERVEKTSKE